MKINLKTLVFGIIIGILLSSTVAFGASTIKEAYFNDALKISVNNAAGDVEIVTVTKDGEQYGRNYVSVADYNKLLNDGAGLNLTTDFDQKSGTIVVQSKVESVSSTKSAEVKAVSETTDKITQTPDGITQIDTIDGKQYVAITYIRKKIIEKGYAFQYTSKTKTWDLVKGDISTISAFGGTNLEVVIENVPTINKHGAVNIELNYYIDTMLPLIK